MVLTWLIKEETQGNEEKGGDEGYDERYQDHL
jgi:hypothetical protein